MPESSSDRWDEYQVSLVVDESKVVHPRTLMTVVLWKSIQISNLFIS